MKLYSYWRSTTSYRVRIALNLKGVSYTSVPVDLVAGDQRSDDYVAVNPGRGVPALVLEDGAVLTQSMAILDWLEETHPEPALLPSGPVARAHVRAAALGIATDIHPVNNLRVVGRLKSMGHSQDEAVDWMNHWMIEGFTAFQSLIERDTPFCFGEAPGLADLCLVPQLYNAHRWGTDLTRFARLTEIEARCLDLAAFDAARPEAQADAKQ
ncbi:MAG TPA: maleylacetoacetate isomerase [Maritimibacter sp.]|nr:maleylacetoacetate isomerase [Maritimibacter sp.]